MRMVVVGGLGRIGARVVTTLTRGGHDVVAASRRSGADIITGAGLAEALRGASVVVDVSDSPAFGDAEWMKFFTTGTGNLLAREAAAGVGHHVAVSIVGIDRLPNCGYYRAKVAQEELIKDSSIPYSIVRATQFFEFLGTIADVATQGSTVRVPAARMQPIAADDVARAVADLATDSPLNGTVEIGGPERFYFAPLMRRVLGARNDPREVIADRHAQYFGTLLEESSLVPGDKAKRGAIRFDDWLGRH